jgi:hypothetical protein
VIGFLKRWAVAIGGALTAVLVVLAAARASNRNEQAEAMTRTAESLMRSNVKKEIERGQNLALQAEGHKQAAAKAEAKMEERLEKIAANNTSLDAVADRFNSRRLRKRTDDPAA